MYLSVVIPAYNEAKTLGGTLQEVGEWLSRQSFDGEIVVVNNRSADATSDIVRGMMHRFPFIRLLDEPRGGKGYAVQTGMLFSGGQMRLFMDADNATSVDHFERCKPFLEQGYDIVIGSIAVPGAVVSSGRGEPLWRVVLGKLGNLWIQLLAVPGIRDTQRGFKVFTAKATLDIFPRLTIFGWGFDVEVLAIARAKGYRIREVPITWKHNRDSRVTMWAYPKTILDTLKVFRNKITGRYAS